MNKEQIIYVNMDDSGILINNKPDDRIFVYGGIFFLSLEEQENFSRQYKYLVNNIKPKYCKNFKIDDAIAESFCLKHNHNNCKYKCPELKSSMLYSNHRRRLLNFIKKFDTSVAIVENNRLQPHIFDSAASKGRFKDYTIKRLVKEIIKHLIETKRINPLNKVTLILNLDEQTTLSNGYYDLKSSIKEELQFGTHNFDYGITFKPLLLDVCVKTNYKNSYYNYPVQAADLIVGEVRHAYYNFLETKDFEIYKDRTKFVNTILNLP